MMSYQRKSAARVAIAFVVSIALAFSLLPLLPQSEAHADIPATFNIDTRLGTDEATKVTAKTFTSTELTALTQTHQNDVRGFLQSKGMWTVWATNEYIPIEELLTKAGVVFNEGDALLFWDSGTNGYYDKTTFEYERIQTDRNFYPGTGTTSTAAVTDGPKPVGSVLAFSCTIRTNVSGTAGATLITLGTNLQNGTATIDPDGIRFLMGVSEANYLKFDAAGSRFAAKVASITVAKDKADTITEGGVTLAKTTYEAIGEPIKPEDVTVKYGGVTLTKDRDYTLTYGENTLPGLDVATVTVKGNGNFTGKVTKKFTITTAISKAKVTLKKTTYPATGRKIQPGVRVKYGDKTLIPPTDYTVVYGTNTLGKGTVTIRGEGFYTGQTVKNFKIKPRPVSIRIVKVGKKKATVKWIKAPDAVTGYQIAYKKKGTAAYKTINVKGRAKVSKVITKLTAKKKYSFKIRTYKTAGGVTYYSAYSKVKNSAKIKK
jgi:hypothetical protein